MGSAARYYPRAPRYVFRPEDESLMRYAAMETRGTALKARIRDLSTSGLSIIVDSDQAPEVGETLKIEFSVPGSKKVAWFATVVRIERRSDWSPDFGHHDYTVVGLKFRQLPAPFTKAIQNCVKKNSDQERSGLISASPKALQELYMFWFMGAVLIILLTLMAIPPSFWLSPFRELFK